MAQLKVQQKRSTIGCKPNQRETLRSLGLRKIGDIVVKDEFLPGDLDAARQHGSRIGPLGR